MKLYPSQLQLIKIIFQDLYTKDLNNKLDLQLILMLNSTLNGRHLLKVLNGVMMPKMSALTCLQIIHCISWEHQALKIVQKKLYEIMVVLQLH